MPAFICEKCGCIDNTACGGTYWGVATAKNSHRNDQPFKEDFYNKHPVCVACKPREYSDGSKDVNAGKWHNSFERKHWTEYQSTIEKLETSQNERPGSLMNDKSYIEQVKGGELQESLVKSW